MKRGIGLIENKDWKCLRKGDRVRKYKNRHDRTTEYIDGTVIKGIRYYSDGFVYVQWDGQQIIDMSVNSYDLVKLQQNRHFMVYIGGKNEYGDMYQRL